MATWWLSDSKAPLGSWRDARYLRESLMRASVAGLILMSSGAVVVRVVVCALARGVERVSRTMRNSRHIYVAPAMRRRVARSSAERSVWDGDLGLRMKWASGVC